MVLGADTRATGGQTVCDRNCDKIHILAANIACCGAGTSVDAVRITEVPGNIVLLVVVVCV